MKSTPSTVLLLAALLAATSSQATVYFQNTGTVSGWNSPNVNPVPGDDKGTVTQVTSPTYKTSTALKATQTYDPAYSARTGYKGGYHAEVVKFGFSASGDKYFGQAIMLPSSWLFHNTGNDTFEQVSSENPSGPWSLTYIQGTSVKCSTVGTVGTISKGVWTRVVIHYKFGSSGACEVWLNGARKISKTGINVTANGSPTVRWSNGIYCTAWRNHKPTDPDAGDLFNQLTRTIYHDQFRVASTLAEADPLNW